MNPHEEIYTPPPDPDSNNRESPQDNCIGELTVATWEKHSDPNSLAVTVAVSPQWARHWNGRRLNIEVGGERILGGTLENGNVALEFNRRTWDTLERLVLTIEKK